MLPFRCKFCVYHSTMHQVTVSLHSKPHIHRLDVCVFSCNLPPALLPEWPGSFTCYCGNTGVFGQKYESAQKVDPWEENSPSSCRDSNLGPFDHESDALTTELSPLPNNNNKSDQQQQHCSCRLAKKLCCWLQVRLSRAHSRLTPDITDWLYCKVAVSEKWQSIQSGGG